MVARYLVMLLASERWQRRIDDMLIGAWAGTALFFFMRWLGWLG